MSLAKQALEQYGDVTLIELKKDELNLIRNKISSIYDDVLGKYDAHKYPEVAYTEACRQFQSKTIDNSQIENAMKWKWGHWGKANYPQHHKDLIKVIESVWREYVNVKCDTPKDTFDYWKSKLEKPHRYLSVAFITHLIYPEYAPIIDQHNYRAMTHLVSITGRKRKAKKKPSNWEDIEDLRVFLNFVSSDLRKENREVDKFLMMYGRYCAPR